MNTFSVAIRVNVRPEAAAEFVDLVGPVAREAGLRFRNGAPGLIEGRAVTLASLGALLMRLGGAAAGPRRGGYCERVGVDRRCVGAREQGAEVMGQRPDQPGSYKERTFYDWLGEQRPRRDGIGTWARGVWEDTGFPRGVSSEADLVSYMEGRGAHGDAIETAREAWEEFGTGATAYTPPDEIVDWEGDEDDRRGEQHGGIA
ncbi:MAG: YozE family protein [Phycisphaerales bacterium]